MNEEKVIATMKECVDYLAKKYKFGRAKEQEPYYCASNDNNGHEKGYVSLEMEEPDAPLEFYFILGCYEKYVNIRVSTKEECLKSCSVVNDFEDFDYVYGKIKEAIYDAHK